MKKAVIIILAACVLVSALAGLAAADSKKTWANIGKGLAIYEGVKVVTGREGNIVQDVTGGMRPAGSSQQQTAQSSSYDDGYNAGYQKGYETGYNAGFRAGIEHDESPRK
jgi:opacity protein-like surface antigen